MPMYEYMKGGKKHYRYAFEVKDSNGKRKTIKAAGFKGKTECRTAEALARAEWEKGQYIAPSSINFGEYLTEWLKNKKDITDQVRYNNEGHIRNHIIPAIGFIPLQKLSYIDIENLVDDLQKKGLASGTIKKIFNLVQTSLKSAVKKELITRNPIDRLDSSSKPKTSKSKTDYWSQQEVITFLSRLNHRLKVLFVIAIYTGMRRGEILGLKWKDIDFQRKQIRIVQTLGFYNVIKIGAKTSAGSRTITVSDYVIEELKLHKRNLEKEKQENPDKYDDQDFVICNIYGKPLSTANFHKFWIRRVESTGVRKIRFHDLRHTCASLMFSAGVHPKIVQEMLGHSSIKVTLDMYSHMMPNMQADAANAMEQLLKHKNNDDIEK